MRSAFYTVGHSTRTVAGLVELLRAGDVMQIVDVRAMPRSRANPQFNAEALAPDLARYEIGYTHGAELAGLRGRDKQTPASVNGYWRNRSFHNYADYALSTSFQNGLDALQALGREQICAVMCSEALWWRCHRRIIADHLLHRGWAVYHLMDRKRVEPAALTPAARVNTRGALIYPTPD